MLNSFLKYYSTSNILPETLMAVKRESIYERHGGEKLKSIKTKFIILSFIKFSLLSLILFPEFIFSQETDTILWKKDVNEKKIVIGIGLHATSGVFHEPGLGGNLKFDYLLTYKFSIGLKSMYTTTNTFYVIDYSYSNTSPESYNIKYTILDLVITPTFYIFGNNKSKHNGGMYAILGLGYSDKKGLFTVTSLKSVSDSAFFDYSLDEGSKVFSSLISIGADYKLGPGRIYFEIPYRQEIYGTYFQNLTSSNKPKPSGWGYMNYTGYSRNMGNIYFNLGYQFYF